VINPFRKTKTNLKLKLKLKRKFIPQIVTSVVQLALASVVFFWPPFGVSGMAKKGPVAGVWWTRRRGGATFPYRPTPSPLPTHHPLFIPPDHIAPIPTSKALIIESIFPQFRVFYYKISDKAKNTFFVCRPISHWYFLRWADSSILRGKNS